MVRIALYLLTASLGLPCAQVTAQHGVESIERAVAPAPQSTEEALRSLLANWVKERDIPGATAAVIFPDGNLISVAAGISRKDPATPMKPTDRMFSGSIGKTYWLAVALQLVDEGRLKLDARVQEIIGDAPWYSRLPNAGTMTVRQLMNHTSGVPEHVQSREFIAALKAEPQKVWKPEELAAFVFDKPARFEAGKEGAWSYADTNYVLLGIVVEKVIGGSFDAEVERRILKKLELKDTERADRAKLDRLVSGYCGPGNPFTDKEEVAADGVYFMNSQFEWCGGGFISTSADLARWAKLLYAGDVITPETMKQMLEGVPAKTGPGDKYGLGVQVWTLPCGTAVGHSGWFPGYSSYMAWFPEQRIAVAAQVNTDVPGKAGKLRGLLCELVRVATDQGERR